MSLIFAEEFTISIGSSNGGADWQREVGNETFTLKCHDVESMIDGSRNEIVICWNKSRKKKQHEHYCLTNRQREWQESLEAVKCFL